MEAAAAQRTLDEQLFPFLDELLQSSMKEITQIRFDKADPQQLFSIILYARIIELSYAIAKLVEAGMSAAIPVILRTLFEAFANLLVLSTNAGHIKSMYASAANQKLRLLHSKSRSPENPFLAGLQFDVEQEITGVTEELTDLKAQGYAPLQLAELFERAELRHEYPSMYWQMSLHAHNNPVALLAHHIETVGSGQRINVFPPPSPGDLIREIDTLCAMLVRSSSAARSITDARGVSAPIDGLNASFEAIRAQYRSKET